MKKAFLHGKNSVILLGLGSNVKYHSSSLPSQGIFYRSHMAMSGPTVEPSFGSLSMYPVGVQPCAKLSQVLWPCAWSIFPITYVARSNQITVRIQVQPERNTHVGAVAAWGLFHLHLWCSFWDFSIGLPLFHLALDYIFTRISLFISSLRYIHGHTDITIMTFSTKHSLC